MDQKSKVNFEDALEKLEKIVQKLEKGELSLDESIEYFQEGVELSKLCTRKLDEVEKKITLLIENDKGEIKEKEIAVE